MSTQLGWEKDRPNERNESGAVQCRCYHDEIAKEILSAMLDPVSKEVGKAGAATLLEKGIKNLLKAKQDSKALKLRMHKG